MLPTLKTNDSLNIDESAYEDAPPAIGDIVVLQGPQGVSRSLCGVDQAFDSPCPVADDEYGTIRLIKRVVAGPGDTVAFDPRGRLIRDGQLVDEPYILECPGTCGLPNAVTVPEDHYFVVGDNRPKSSDSRIWGAVPVEAFDAEVLLDE